MDSVLVKSATGLMLLTGIVMMFSNIMKYHHWLSNNKQLIRGAQINLQYIFGFNLILMVFFFFGYIGVFCAVIYSVSYFNEALVGVVFLFGAVFVLLSIFVQNHMLIQVRENYFNTIRMLVRAVEIRDPYTMGHSEHVANLCMLCYAHLPQSLQKGIDAELLGAFPFTCW